jgi:hypothetical protein
VVATLGAGNDVVVSWNAVSGATDYKLYLDGSYLLTVGPVTSVDYGPLACGETFTPGVQATNSQTGLSSSITTATVTTSDCGTGPEPTPLAAPTGLATTYTAQNHVVLTWNPVSGAGDYNVYRNGSYVASTTSTSYDLGYYACGQTLSPGVQSRASGGRVSTTATITVSTPACEGGTADTTPPSTPQFPTEYFPSNGGFVFGWNPSSDNVGVTGYSIFLNGTQVATVAPGTTVPVLGSIGYTFSGLSCGTSYQVAVSAYDAAGNTSVQATLTATTAGCPSSLAAPTGVYTVVSSTNDVELYWTQPAGVTHFYLWLNGTRLLGTGGSSADYGPLACGQTFTLGIQSWDTASGQVSTISTATAVTNPC